MLFFVVLLLIWGINLGITKNLDRRFFEIPVFSHKEQDIFMDIFMQSRLSCGAKCTELSSHCSSFAWDEVETRCLLLASTLNLVFLNSSTQIGDNWEYFHLKAIKSIAVGKPAVQSTTYDGYYARYAVDGLRNTDVTQRSCTHTSFGDSKPWWRVDLGTIYSVLVVRMLNRGTDSFGIDQSGRLHDVTITVETKEHQSKNCGFFAGPGRLAELVIVECPPNTVGRYVRISKISEFLSLCEVDVLVEGV